VLDSLLDFSGIPRSSAYGVFRVMDKLDKIGLEGVVAELTSGRIDVSGDTIKGLGLATDRVDRIREFVAMPHGPEGCSCRPRGSVQGRPFRGGGAG